MLNIGISANFNINGYNIIMYMSIYVKLSKSGRASDNNVNRGVLLSRFRNKDCVRGH